MRSVTNGVSPHDLDAERWVLGAILADNSLLPLARAEANSKDFFRRDHEVLFESMNRLAERGQPIDLLTLMAEAGSIDANAAYVASLTDGMPRSANVAAYARVVRERARARHLIAVAERAQALLYRGDVAGGMAALQNVLVDNDSVSNQSSGRFRLVDDLALITRPASPELVEGYLPAQGVAVLVGESGSLKSFLALDLAISVSTQPMWLDRHVRRSGPTVWVGGEGTDGLGVRLAGLKDHLGLRADQPIDFHLIDHPVDLLDRRQVEKLIRSIREIKPALVVFDTLARCTAGADENSGRDMGLALSGLERVSRVLDCLSLAIHHPNATAKRERGHSSLRAHVDAMLFTKRHHNRVRLRVEKLREGPEPRDITVTFIPSSDGTTLVVQRDRRAGGLSRRERDILAVLQSAPDGCLKSDWQRGCAQGVAERTFYRAAVHLIQSGFVQAVGRLHFLTDEGRCQLAGAHSAGGCP